MKLASGTTSKILRVFVQDSRSNAGAGLTGLAYNAAGLVASYAREGAGRVAISLVTASVGTFTSSGWIEIDATNMPGWYELGIPNAAIAAGSAAVEISLQGAANMVPVAREIELDQPASFALLSIDAAGAVAPQAATYQKIAKEAYSVAGTAWHVATTGNDTTGDGLTWATAYATPGKAVSVAAAGDLILCGVGSFAVPSTVLAGISLAGAGADLTTITGPAFGNCLRVSGNLFIRDLTIDGSAGAPPLADSATALVRVNNCRVIGVNDCLLLGHSGTLLRACDTRWECAWDTINAAAGTAYEGYRCRHTTAGSLSVGTNVSVSGGSVKLYDCHVVTAYTGSNALTVVASLYSYGNAGGAIEMRGGSIRTTAATVGIVHDLYADNAAALLVDVAHTPSLVASANGGTVTYANTPINGSGQIASGAIATNQAGVQIGSVVSAVNLPAAPIGYGGTQEAITATGESITVG